MVTKSLCASHHCTLISQADNAVTKFYVDNPRRANWKGAHTFQQGQAACRKLLTRKTDKERVPDVVTPLNSHSSWVCRYQVAQMLERQKVQRIAFERMALGSQCLSRQGCIVRHQVHHTDAVVMLDILMLSHTSSAAQPQVWSRKTNSSIH